MLFAILGWLSLRPQVCVCKMRIYCRPGRLKGQLCMRPSVRCPLIERPVVISRKLSKTNPLRWNTIGIADSSIQIHPRRTRWRDILVSSEMWPRLSVNRARPPSNLVLLTSCCKQSACGGSNLLAIVIVGCVCKTCGTTPKSSKRRASFFSHWRYSCS